MGQTEGDRPDLEPGTPPCLPKKTVAAAGRCGQRAEHLPPADEPADDAAPRVLEHHASEGGRTFSGSPAADASSTSFSSGGVCAGRSRAVRNKILVLGRSVRHEVQVLERIFELCGSSKAALELALPALPAAAGDQGDPASIDTHVAEDAEPLVIPWTIDTKYYAAKVDFWLDACPLGVPQDGVLKAYNEIGHAFDAFVFVYDKSTPKAIDDLSHWLPFVNFHEPSITLCVGGSFLSVRKAGPADANSEEADSAAALDTVALLETWCSERGFEYVDLDAERPRDSDGQEDANAEKVGTERLLEALQTHLWEGLKRKSDANESGRQADSFDNEGDDEEFLDELLNMKVTGFPDQSGGDATDEGSLDFEFESFERTHNQIFGSLDSEDGLEHALESIRSLQEHSKTLRDAERKKLAAEVALSFARQLEAD